MKMQEHPIHSPLAVSGTSPPVRAAIIVGSIILVAAFHWLTPTSHLWPHMLHVLLRKLFILPVVLAAIWFDLKGAVIAAGVISILYVPHVLLQWSGQSAENLNQAGEIITIWLTAILAGTFARIEKGALVEVARTHEGALIALVAALDAREHDTRLHSLRVRQYALRIGEELGLCGDDLRVLGQGSLLHDIGKIGVPDAILLKPGPLTDEEWTEMRRHPELGRQIADSVPFLHDAAEIIHCHHERYDGTGYPRGLAENRIPLAARVFAVADVFDALTTDRPYHSKISFEKAQQAIEMGAGEHFDPDVARAFLAIPCSEWHRIELHVAKHGAQLAVIGDVVNA